MNNKPLSLPDFKNWLSSHQDMKALSEFFSISRDEIDPNEKYVGCPARAKVSEQKLLERVETDDDAEALINEFVENGGTVVGVDGKMFEIEVESGTFSIPRFCLKLKQD